MYISIKNETINGIYINVGTTVRHDRQVYEVRACEMQDESRAGYPIKERVTTDKASALRTYGYYKNLARKGEI